MTSPRLCVFCGSRTGDSASFTEQSRAAVRAFAERGWDFVYGGAGVGLMNQVADTALAAGRSVTGILPEVLFDYEVSHDGLTELLEVPDMHVRKRKMTELSDAFLVLPGGLGTLDELFENLTWRQLGIHDKPLGILNVDGYFQPMLDFLQSSIDHGFVDSFQIDRVVIGDTVEDVCERLIAACARD